MDKEVTIQLLTKFKACLLIDKDQVEIAKVVEELDSTLKDLSENSYEGVTLPIRLSDFTHKINMAMAFGGLRFSEQQSKNWELLKAAVVKGREGDRVGLSMILSIM